MRRKLVAAMAMSMVLGTACSDGCKNGSPATQPGSDQATQAELSPEHASIYGQSWAAFVASNPAAFTGLVEANGQNAWVKLYQRDYSGAQQAFSSGSSDAERLGLARALLEEATVLEQAYLLSLDIGIRYQKLLTENAARLTRTSLSELAAALLEARSGNHVGISEHLKAYRAGSGAGSHDAARFDPLATVLEGAVLFSGGDQAGAQKLWTSPAVTGNEEARLLSRTLTLEVTGSSAAAPMEDEPASPYGKRLYLQTLVARGELSAAQGLLERLSFREADFQEQISLEGGSVDRHYYDPGLLHSLSQLSAARAQKALEGLTALPVYQAQAQNLLAGSAKDASAAPPPVDASSLSSYLFSRYPTPGDVSTGASPPPAGGLIGAYLSALGPVPKESMEGRDTRQAVVVAQQFQDAARRVVDASANEEGRNTVIGLKLLDADVSQAIRARAEAYRAQGNFLAALFLLEHTVDKEAGKVNYLNDPLLLLSITRVYCMLGRYREALNYSYRLVESRPELWALQETLGNLSVLDTVDRAGRTGGQD